MSRFLTSKVQPNASNVFSAHTTSVPPVKPHTNLDNMLVAYEIISNTGLVYIFKSILTIHISSMQNATFHQVVMTISPNLPCQPFAHFAICVSTPHLWSIWPIGIYDKIFENKTRKIGGFLKRNSHYLPCFVNSKCITDEANTRDNGEYGNTSNSQLKRH